jgi:hypothetical protein
MRLVFNNYIQIYFLRKYNKYIFARSFYTYNLNIMISILLRNYIVNKIFKVF